MKTVVLLQVLDFSFFSIKTADFFSFFFEAVCRFVVGEGRGIGAWVRVLDQKANVRCRVVGHGATDIRRRGKDQSNG